MSNNEPQLSSSEITPEKSQISEPNSIKSSGILRRDGYDDWLPWVIGLGLLAMVGIFFALGRIAVINSDKSNAEKKRADALQQSVNALKNRSSQDQAFFEIVRKLMISQGDAERQALIDELRKFQFGDGSTAGGDFSTTTTPPTSRSNPNGRSTTTTTTPSSTTTTTSTSSPSTTTTTTTRPSPFPHPPPTIVCVPAPLLGPVCT